MLIYEYEPEILITGSCRINAMFKMSGIPKPVFHTDTVSAANFHKVLQKRERERIYICTEQNDYLISSYNAIVE
jgi:hypothetical protein